MANLSSSTASLLTLMCPDQSWFPIIRPYTPISDLDEPGQLELMIKRYPTGAASNHLCSLIPGDTLTFLATLKGPQWEPNVFSQVLLLAGGVGITPIYQLARGILKNSNDKTKITLVIGVNTERDLLLHEELESYAKRFPDRFSYLYTISHPVNLDSPHRQGHINEQLLSGLLKGPIANTKVFVCGPPAMKDSLVGSRASSQGTLSRLGFANNQIYKF